MLLRSCECWPFLWPHGCSGRRRAQPPARLGDLTSFGAAPRSPPVPSGPSGTLHTGGAGCAGVWLGASSRSPARPHHRPPAPRPCPATAHGRCSQASSSAPRPHPEFGPAGRVLLRRREPQTPHNTCRPPRLKPMTPMRVDHCHEMKPLTPLLPQNSQFQAIFRPQRRHRLHAPLAE